MLAANRAVAKTAKPGMTLRELNDVCKKVLAEGCIRMGLLRRKRRLENITCTVFLTILELMFMM